MQATEQRAQLIQQLRQSANANQQWDLIVIGGGIVGAGVFNHASKMGLKVLLLEQQDFAWGSSSRSSKMVHGGLRYVAQGAFKLTQESVQERELLIRQAGGLVHSASYVMSHFSFKWPGRTLFTLLMWIYSFFAGRKQHRLLAKHDYQLLLPGGRDKRLVGGTQYVDGLTDDARLVMRLLFEGQDQGGVAVNYCQVKGLVRDGEQVTGVEVALAADQADLAQADAAQADPIPASPELLTLSAKMVVNATGAWASGLDPQVIIRPLRGSHILVPNWRLPIANVNTLLHPEDGRPVMIYPWQNTTLIGTTDVDHRENMASEPKISQTEFDYLLHAITTEFPNAKITAKDVISTFAGVRPIVLDHPIDERVKASSEKREHSLFEQPGFITVTGGKLTTFRKIAEEVMIKACQQLNITAPAEGYRLFDSVVEPHDLNVAGLESWDRQYICGRFGDAVPAFLAAFGQPELLQTIRYSPTLWAELLWAASHEQIVHLDDLLLRRTRIGNVLPNGAAAELGQIWTLCKPYLGWSENQWQQERQRYLALWQQHYSLPGSPNDSH